MRVYIYVLYIHMCIHMYIYIYIHTYIYLYVHAYTYTYMHYLSEILVGRIILLTAPPPGNTHTQAKSCVVYACGDCRTHVYTNAYEYEDIRVCDRYTCVRQSSYSYTHTQTWSLSSTVWKRLTLSGQFIWSGYWHAHTQPHAQLHTHMHARTHIHTRTHTHTHTHTLVGGIVYNIAVWSLLSPLVRQKK